MIPPLLALLTPAWVGSSSSPSAGGLFLNNLEEQVKKKKKKTICHLVRLICGINNQKIIKKKK